MATERIDIVITENGSKKVKRTLDDIGGSAKRSSGLLDGLKGVLGLVGGALSVRKVSQYGEAWTDVNNRLGLVTDSMQELTIAQNDVFDIAQRTLAPLAETADLYARLDRSSKSLGLSQNDLAGITQTINQTLAISGASATASAAALTQLGQAYASGVLRGEEFNSVSEQTPRLTQAIAEGLGVEIGALRELAKEGKLTADVVTKALQSQADVISNEFANITIKPTQAFTVLENSAIRLVGELNGLSGQTGVFAGQLIGLADIIDSGIIQSEFLRQIQLWGDAFAVAASDVDDFGNELILLNDIAGDLATIGTRAFLDFPANILAVTKIGAVEVAAFVERTTALFSAFIDNTVAIALLPAEALENGFNAAFTSFEQGVTERANVLTGALKSLDSLRKDSIALILEERDAILAAAEAESQSFDKRREQLQAETDARRKQREEDRKNAAEGGVDLDIAKIQTFGDAATEILGRLSEQGANLNDSLTTAFGDAAVALRGEFSDALAESIVQGESFEDIFKSAASTISQSLLSAIIDIGVQQVANAALGNTLRAAATTSAVASNATITASAAPAAAAEAGATFGASAIAGAAALAALFALGSQAFADGGFVSGPGSGRSDSIPARLSNGEFVVNAQATRQNRQMLEAINGGRRFADGGAVGQTQQLAPQPQQQNQQPINIVNVTDPKMVEDVLSSPSGERTLVNVIQRNASAINAVLR